MGCTVGPTMSMLLNDLPVDVLAEVSKTALTLVEVLDDL